MDKKMVLLVVAFTLLLGCAYASTVSRSFSSATVQPGSDLTVTLAVNITAGETFYVVDETLPIGWTIKNPGTGATGHAGHIKWVVIQDATNTTYTYTLTAPSQTATAGFAGTYMFEGMASEAQIDGQSQVSVSQGSQEPAEGTTDYLLVGIVVIVVIGVLVIAYKKYIK